jgi:hypothetical protein
LTSIIDVILEEDQIIYRKQLNERPCKLLKLETPAGRFSACVASNS